MSTEYELVTIKDIFDKVPTDKIDVCLSEIGAAMKQAQSIRDAMQGFAVAMTGDKGNAHAIWPEKQTWVDDGKGDVQVHTTIELRGQAT